MISFLSDGSPVQAFWFPACSIVHGPHEPVPEWRAHSTGTSHRREAIIGLLIEITFIATFTQRFFAR